LLERGRSPVPELGGVEHRVQHRRAVALGALGRCRNALGEGLVVDEALGWIMAGGACHLIVRRQALLVEELLAERHLLGRRLGARRHQAAGQTAARRRDNAGSRLRPSSAGVLLVNTNAVSLTAR